MESDFFTHAEAELALWDMQVRERDMTQTTEVARRLAHDFPDNRKLAAFPGGSRGEFPAMTLRVPVNGSGVWIRLARRQPVATD